MNKLFIIPILLLVFNTLRANDTTLVTVSFRYDAAGNRVGRSSITFKGGPQSAPLAPVSNLGEVEIADSAYATNELEEALPIERYESGNQFTVYPNPTSGKLIFEIKEIDKYEETGELTVYDENGKRIFYISKIRRFNHFDFSYLATGVYFIELKSESKTRRWKIIRK